MKKFSRLLVLAFVLIFVSNSSEAQWTNITPHGSPVDFLSIAAISNGSSGTYLFAAGLGTGITMSGNNGGSWTSENIGLSGSELQTVAASGSTVYAGTLQNGAYASTDNGTTWAQIDSGFPTLVAGLPERLPVVSFGFSGNNIFAGTEYLGGIYQLNGAKTVWTNSNAILSNWVLNFLAVSDTELLAATCSGILGSRDHGQTWSSRSANMGKDSVVECVAVVPNGSGGRTILAGISLANGEADGGILASTDGGNSWSLADSGIGYYFIPGIYLSVNALAVSGTNVFAGTNGSGLFLSTNQGKFWTRIDQGLNDSTFEGLLVYHDTLYAAGFHGVYRSPISQLITAVKENRGEIPAGFSLSQNYPNPFNPSTQISFSIAKAGFVSLKVFDVLGREVATLVNQVMEPSSHTVTWNAANVASGAYFYRLQSGSEVQTKKLLLMK